MDEPRLTVSGAARRLGVAPGTLRTWDRRYGIGPTGHEHGRHRRYSAADMARLELMQHALVRGAAPAEAARYAHSAVVARAPAPAPDPAPTRRPWPDPSAGIDVIASLGSPDPRWHRRVVLPEVPVGRARWGGHSLRMPGAGPAARGLARAALALDSTAVCRLVEESVDRDGVAVTWDDVVRPVLDVVEARTDETGRGVEVARLLGECAVLVFHVRAHAAPAALPARPALLAGMPGDGSTAALAALGALLAERRIACRSLGAALPADALTAAVRRIAPSAVVLWAQRRATADVAVVAGLPVTRPRFRTYVAGAGWDGAALPRGAELVGSLADAGDRIGAAVAR